MNSRVKSLIERIQDECRAKSVPEESLLLAVNFAKRLSEAAARRTEVSVIPPRKDVPVKLNPKLRLEWHSGSKHHAALTLNGSAISAWAFERGKEQEGFTDAFGACNYVESHLCVSPGLLKRVKDMCYMPDVKMQEMEELLESYKTMEPRFDGHSMRQPPGHEDINNAIHFLTHHIGKYPSALKNLVIMEAGNEIIFDWNQSKYEQLQISLSDGGICYFGDIYIRNDDLGYPDREKSIHINTQCPIPKDDPRYKDGDYLYEDIRDNLPENLTRIMEHFWGS